MAELTAHPVADLFPMLSQADFEALKQDIEENGLMEPIWLYEGRILDGRNRYRACVEIDVEPTTRDYEGDSPVAFVWSLNGTRRHLTSSQRAAIAVEMLPHLEEEARARYLSTQKQNAAATEKLPGREQHGEARAIAAQLTGTNARYVSDAKRLKAEDPEAFEAVKRGEEPVGRAIARLPKKERAPARHGDRSPAERAKRVESTRALAAEGYRATQIAEIVGISEERVRQYARDEDITLPDEHIGKVRRIDPNRVIQETAFGLSGYGHGLDTIKGDVDSIDSEQAAAWLELINDAMPNLNWLRRTLKEISNAEAA